MIVTAALYARVSTPNQEEEDTIDSQVAAIERYIQDHGYDLPSEFYFLDKAVSGARLDRPALDRLRHLASDGAFALVVCYSPDRLSRSYPHQWVIMDELQRNGVRVEFVNQPDLGDNPQAQLLLGVQGLFAEYERAMIKERLRMGRLYKIRTGQLMHNATPYGYRYVPKEAAGGSRWVIEEREAEAVRQIFKWYIGSENWPIAKIIDKLNQDYTHVLRRATRWQFSLVHGILTQTAYYGRAFYNRKRILPETVGTARKTGRGKRKAAQFEWQPEKEWIELTVPALIEPIIWEAIANLLQNPDQIAAAWEAETVQYDTTPDELGRLQARQRKLEQQWVRLLDAFQDGLLDKDELGQRKQNLDKDRQNIVARIGQMQRQREKHSAKAEIMTHFAEFCATAQKALENPTSEVKQEVLRLLVESIVIEGETVTIKHIIPNDEKCQLLPRDLRYW